MRAPSKHIDCDNHHIQAYQVRVEIADSVTDKEHSHLDYAKSRYAKQRAERPPFRQEYEQHDSPQEQEDNQREPQPVARQTKPKQTERGSNPLAALEFVGDGEDVPKDYTQTAKITHEVGHERFRAFEISVAVDEKPYQCGDTTLERIEKEGREADF